MRAAVVIYVPIRSPVRMSSQSSSKPYVAPTLELIKRLPGPKTTQAVIRAGPIERHHGEGRSTLEVSDGSDTKYLTGK
jgi:hypothetical protein